MIPRRSRPDLRTPRAFEDFHDWALSLPWVVERPYSSGAPGIRSFGVDCAPLGRRCLWLLTGLHHELQPEEIGLGVIVSAATARELERAGRGRRVAPMPDHRAMVSVFGEALEGRDDVEALVLAAYGEAMS
jgi:hypothetical protein